MTYPPQHGPKITATGSSPPKVDNIQLKFLELSSPELTRNFL
jgi:hypothetical protein